MTILDILTKAGFAAGELIDLLHALERAAPDFTPAIEAKVAALEAAVDGQALIALATILPAEIGHISQGKIEPRDHPSDAG